MHDDPMTPHQPHPARSPVAPPAAVPGSIMSLLDIRMTVTGTGPVLMLSGEADINTLAQLKNALNMQITAGARILTADLSGLRFADAATIGVLAAAARTLNAQGGRLDLLNPQLGPARVLTLLGADQILTIRREAGPGPGHPCPRPNQMAASHGRARRQRGRRACR